MNCFHAMADIYELYPSGEISGSGFDMWEINGTECVLIE